MSNLDIALLSIVILVACLCIVLVVVRGIRIIIHKALYGKTRIDKLD
jgi:hypothetical protein